MSIHDNVTVTEKSHVLYRLIEQNNQTCDQSSIIEHQKQPSLRISSISFQQTPRKYIQKEQNANITQSAQISRKSTRKKKNILRNRHSKSSRSLLPDSDSRMQRCHSARSYVHIEKWRKHSLRSSEFSLSKKNSKFAYQSSKLATSDVFTPRQAKTHRPALKRPTSAYTQINPLTINKQHIFTPSLTATTPTRPTSSMAIQSFQNQVIKNVLSDNNVKRIFSAQSTKEFSELEIKSSRFSEIAGQTNDTTENTVNNLDSRVHFEIKSRIKQHIKQS